VSAQSGPVLVELGGWQIFANEVSAQGTHLRFEQVQASRGQGSSWTLVADSLLVSSRVPGLVVADGWFATGSVRLSGPDDIYVIAQHMTTLNSARKLVFSGADKRPSLVGEDWQLMATTVAVDLNTARIHLEDL
jgi:hypothetical protein